MIITPNNFIATYIHPLKNFRKVEDCHWVNTNTMTASQLVFGEGGLVTTREIKIDRLVARDTLPEYFLRALRKAGVEIISAQVLEELPNYDE